MRIAFTAYVERLRSSFFFIPMLGVVIGLVVGQASIIADTAISRSSLELPFLLQATVDSARAVLSTVATATISFAGIAFSVSLLVIQLSSSQYSPRVVHSLFRDPFNKRVMGVVVGTFTYCLVVLRSVREALNDTGEPVVPTLSVSLAVLLGVVAILAIVAFINHSAHAMDVSELLHGVTEDSVQSVKANWWDPQQPAAVVDENPPPVDGFPVSFQRNGWIQYVDDVALLATARPGGTVRIEFTVGGYAVAGTPLATVWPVPDPDDRAEVEGEVRKAVQVGRSRTLQEDASYGVRQLVDIALRALSPGTNDPTTAQDAIFHLTTVMHELIERDCPRRAIPGPDGRRLLCPDAPDHAGLVALAYDELRLAANELPTVSVYLLQSISLLCQSSGTEASARVATDALEEQARLIVVGAEDADLLPHDRQRVLHAYESWFGHRAA